jgi:hypothetical protein
MTTKPRKKPNKNELAQMKVLSVLGHSPTAISRKMGKSHHTVIKYLSSEVYKDPNIQKMISIIKSKELDDLHLLGAKSRERLHELLDQGDTKMIETIALMDRSFQQRRLLENKATEINQIQATIDSLDKEIKTLEVELFKSEDNSNGTK